MAKPRLEKVEALFYVLKQVAKGGCIRILIHPHKVSYNFWIRCSFFRIFLFFFLFEGSCSRDGARGFESAAGDGGYPPMESADTVAFASARGG